MSILFSTVTVRKSLISQIERYLNPSGPDDMQSEDDTISVTAAFPDGNAMDIKCCGGQTEPSWTEAVLFNKYGGEICCGEPSDEFIGTWELEANGTKYVAEVVSE